MTDTQSAGERSSVVRLAQLPLSKPVLQTYSRRNRCVCPSWLVQSKRGLKVHRARLAHQLRLWFRSCIPDSVPSAQEAGSLTASAPKSDRQAKVDVTNPFFERCNLQHPKTAPQQPNKRSFTQLHLDVGQVCCMMLSKPNRHVRVIFHVSCLQLQHCTACRRTSHVSLAACVV